MASTANFSETDEGVRNKGRWWLTSLPTPVVFLPRLHQLLAHEVTPQAQDPNQEGAVDKFTHRVQAESFHHSMTLASHLSPHPALSLSFPL